MVDLARKGLGYVPRTAEMLAVEQSFAYRLSNGPARGAQLIGKIDVLVRRPKGMLEHINFKTGWARNDPIQEVICRIGVCGEYGELGVPILSTILQLSTREEICLDGEKAVRDAVLSEIATAIAGIWEAIFWPAQENPRCGICSQRTTLCSVHGAWGKRPH